MQNPKPDWRKNKLLDIFQNYHSAIRARSREGRQHAMRCFYAVLVYEGLNVEKMGPTPGQPFDPRTGAGYLLVEQAYIADVVCAAHISPFTVLRTFPRMPWPKLNGHTKRFVFNFGSATPEWYPCPMTADEFKAFLSRRWEVALPARRPSLVLSQPSALQWEAPNVQ